MPLGKCPARTRLQVLFETACPFLGGEFNRDDEGPWTVVDRVTRWPTVVPLEPRIDVVRDTDIMTRRIGVAADDVNETLREPVHDSTTGANVGPTGKSRKSPDL